MNGKHKYGNYDPKKKRMGRSALAVVMALLLSLGAAFSVSATKTDPSGGGTMQFDCQSAILIEASTGKVLFEQNPDEALPPASVTKVMTLLLVMEAIEAGRLAYGDVVTASAHACSMGGSQIFLEEGEQMTVEDMIKSVVIASANDAAVALAEHISGTEEAFVAQMNERAEALGMVNTHFENTNGLDDTAKNHVTSARDIAIMSRELIRYEKITEYSSIWMDTIRGGAFGLTNTNRLVRFYRGATGLKTGSTSKAGFCVSATAERDGMGLICVIMGAPTRDVRNAAATALLDWGFANFGCYRHQGESLSRTVTGGVRDACALACPSFSGVVSKGDVKRIERSVELPEALRAPIEKGSVVGRVVYRLDGEELGSSDIVASESVERIAYWGVLKKILRVLSVF